MAHALKDIAVLATGLGLAGAAVSLVSWSLEAQATGVPLAIGGFGGTLIFAAGGPPRPRRHTGARRHAGPWLPQIAGDLAAVWGMAGLACLGFGAIGAMFARSALAFDASGNGWFFVAAFALFGMAFTAFRFASLDRPPPE